jgi:hypothetical protein
MAKPEGTTYMPALLRVAVAVEEKRAKDILSVRESGQGRQAVQTQTISLSLPQYKTKDQEAVRQHWTRLCSTVVAASSLEVSAWSIRSNAINIKIDIDEKWWITFSQKKSSGELELINLHQFSNRNQLLWKLIDYHNSESFWSIRCFVYYIKCWLFWIILNYLITISWKVWSDTDNLGDKHRCWGDACLLFNSSIRDNCFAGSFHSIISNIDMHPIINGLSLGSSCPIFHTFFQSAHSTLIVCAT